MIPGRREWRAPAQKPVERFDRIENTPKAPVQMIEAGYGNQQVQRFPLFQDKTIAKTAPEMSESMVAYVKFRAANNRSSCPSESPERDRRPSFHQVDHCLQRIEGPQQDDDKPRARPQYPRCGCTQPVDVRDAIQRTKVGVEPIAASRGKGKRRIVAHPALDEIRNSRSLRFLDDSIGHLSRKIDARNVDAAASQVDGIVSGSAPQIDYSGARRETTIQYRPCTRTQFPAQPRITEPPIVVDGVTVERLPNPRDWVLDSSTGAPWERLCRYWRVLWKGNPSTAPIRRITPSAI